MTSAQDNNKPFKVFNGALRKFLFIFSSLLITAEVPYVLDIILTPIGLDALNLLKKFFSIFSDTTHEKMEKTMISKREN